MAPAGWGTLSAEPKSRAGNAKEDRIRMLSKVGCLDLSSGLKKLGNADALDISRIHAHSCTSTSYPDLDDFVDSCPSDNI